MLDSKVLNTDYDLAEMSDLQRPNLLDNADFKSGIINQRVKTSYNGQSEKDTYTVDRWRISQNTDTTLTVQDGYVSVAMPNNEWVGQYIEYKPDGAMTVAIKLKDNDVKVFSLANYTEDGNTLKYDFGELETNVFVRLYKHTSHDCWQLYIINTTGSTKSFNIEYIKLEKGSVFTGMPQWDYVDELLNCQRFFYPLGGGWIGMFPSRSDENTHSIYIQTPITMRTIPSLIVKDGSDINNANAYLNGNKNPTQPTQIRCSSFTVSEINIFVVLTAPVGSTAQIGYGFAIFQKAMALDAEIY